MTASVSIWHRLEADPFDRDMHAGLEAAVRDPAWMLARQWQVGEFRGDDAGSPVRAELRAESVDLTSYRPALAGQGVDLDATVPLEAQVEREPARLGLRGSVQLGLLFERMLRESGLGVHIAAFRKEFAISETDPAEVADPDSARYRLAVAGRVTDGEMLCSRAATTSPLAQLPPIPALAPGARQPAADAVKALVEYRSSCYSEPAHDSAWHEEQLEYDFSVGSRSALGEVSLAASRFSGGMLDWHAFSGTQKTLHGQATSAVRTSTFAFLPVGVHFHGMPSSRWWDFEDGQTDFGRLEAEKVDLAKLLVMEFALLYGDDWFQLPLPVDAGTLTRITLLVVTDTFGERTIIRETSAQAPAAGEPWSMFEIEGAADWVLMPPLLDAVEGSEIEDVLFVRDEMAGLGWAVERKLQGPLGRAVDGYDVYRQRLAEHPAPEPSRRSPGGPAIAYRLGTTVPDNWIPLVPVSGGPRPMLLRRGLMQRPTESGQLVDVPARGVILEPGRPFYVADEAVPRDGVRVSRTVRRARTVDGETITWFARRRRPGRGLASSGLAFDLVEDLPDPPAA